MSRTDGGASAGLGAGRLRKVTADLLISFGVIAFGLGSPPERRPARALHPGRLRGSAGGQPGRPAGRRLRRGPPDRRRPQAGPRPDGVSSPDRRHRSRRRLLLELPGPGADRGAHGSRRPLLRWGPDRDRLGARCRRAPEDGARRRRTPPSPRRSRPGCRASWHPWAKATWIAWSSGSSRVSRRTEWLAGILGFGGALLALTGVLLARSPRHALSRLGLDLLVAGLLLFLLGPAGRAIVATLPHEALAKRAAAGLWDAFTISLRTWALVLGRNRARAPGRRSLPRRAVRASGSGEGPAGLARAAGHRDAGPTPPRNLARRRWCLRPAPARERRLAPGRTPWGAPGLRRDSGDLRDCAPGPSRVGGSGSDAAFRRGQAPSGGRPRPGCRLRGRDRVARPAAAWSRASRGGRLQRRAGALCSSPGRGGLSRQPQLDVGRRHPRTGSSPSRSEASPASSTTGSAPCSSTCTTGSRSRDG